ncbi:MAG: 4-hydroxy-tetrahydrodipicolinate reductase [Rhodospirillales bacterium]|jgi:4-hydroxy-tetrahydrodipicolinate reductase|nr:4-hydroxy-tetrahydrodipicolinate reductase [Rhodospirillales bacterium]
MGEIRICLAGATGQIGRRLVPAIVENSDFKLVSAVARRAAGRDLGEALGGSRLGIALQASVDDALAQTPADVLVDYTHPTAVRAHVLAALARGVAVVVGTSGLKAADYGEIDTAARAAGVGVATGNFSVTAALLQYLAKIAARHVPQWEIVEYNKAAKPDVPSGTGCELAEMLGAVRPPQPAVADTDPIGPHTEARGAEIAGTRVHSVRLEGFASACEVIFGMPGERLSLRHDCAESAEPFVFGTLFAAREVASRPGLHRGLDSLLFRPDPI